LEVDEMRRKKRKRRIIPLTFFVRGLGFYGRFGRRLDDLEPVSGPEAPELDDYEVRKLKRRWA